MRVTDAHETSADLARRYRRMADATRRLAWQVLRPQDKDAGLDLAMRWMLLADDVRRGPPRAANDA